MRAQRAKGGRKSAAEGRRPLLLLVAITATVVGLLGIAGVFAVLTDRATTGQNAVETDPLEEAPDLDLLLADRAADGTCGEFTDDLTTGLFQVTTLGVDDPFGTQSGDVCVRNAGLHSGWVGLSTIDLDDRDIGCTYREAEVDTSCGADGQGELASVVAVGWAECGSDLADPRSVQALTTGAVPVVELDPGDTAHVCLTAGGLADLPLATSRAAQSDELAWRFAFDLADAPFGGCPSLDAEPNHEASRAIALPVGQIAMGTVCDSADVDVYRVVVADGAAVTVRLEALEPNPPPPLYMLAYDSVFQETWGEAVDGGYELTLTDPGTYLVHVDAEVWDRAIDYSIVATEVEG